MPKRKLNQDLSPSPQAQPSIQPPDLPLHHLGAMSIAQFCAWSAISRGLYFLEVKAGKLVPRKVGRRTIIPIEEAKRWLANLPSRDRKGATPIGRE